jgi:hypothetical protein
MCYWCWSVSSCVFVGRALIEERVALDYRYRNWRRGKAEDCEAHSVDGSMSSACMPASSRAPAVKRSCLGFLSRGSVLPSLAFACVRYHGSGSKGADACNADATCCVDVRVGAVL